MGGCTQAEIYMLMDLIWTETCEKVGDGDSEVCKRLRRVISTVKEMGLDGLRSRLGL